MLNVQSKIIIYKLSYITILYPCEYITILFPCEYRGLASETGKYNVHLPNDLPDLGSNDDVSLNLREKIHYKLSEMYKLNTSKNIYSQKYPFGL